MSHAKPTSHLVLRFVVAPLVAMLVVQLPGCVAKKPSPPPPGGTYRSTNAGATFAQSVAVVDAPAANIAGYALGTIHRLPATPATIYIAAGPNGIIFSTDNGATWQRVATPLTTTADVLLLKNGTLIVAGVGGDGQGYIMRSLDQGRIWDTVHTVPVPTKVGFLKRLNGTAVSTSIITSLAIDPFNPDRVYAATTLGSIFVGEQSAKVWRLLSTLDSSLLANAQSEQLGIRSLYASPYGAKELLVLTAGNHLIRIRDGRQERLRVPLRGEQAATQNFGSGRRVLAAAYIGNQTLLVGAGDGAAISRDDGKTWQALDLPVETNTIFNSVAVAASPTNPRRLFVTINDVIYRSEDGGQNWNIYSLELSQFVISDFSINPANPADVLLSTNALRT